MPCECRRNGPKALLANHVVFAPCVEVLEEADGDWLAESRLIIRPRDQVRSQRERLKEL